MQRIKERIIVSLFGAILLLGGLLHFLMPDQAASQAEQRVLAQVPEFSIKTLLSGRYMEDLESYLLDQFPFRDSFRSMNAIWQLFVLQQGDYNGLYFINGSLYKLEYPLDEAQVRYAGEKMNEVSRLYLDGLDVYYAIVPDKNYFIAQANGYPAMEYDRMVEMMEETTENMTYIPLFDTLTIEDYYQTDTHWRQERIFSAAQRLADGMGVSILPKSDYREERLAPFYGIYTGQSALPLSGETMVYLTNDMIEGATVWNLETDGTAPVYDLEKFEGIYGYDVFLSGSAAMLTIKNPDAITDKELILFRDSFGSSIAPLLIGTYKTITVLDLRYFSSALLGDYVDFYDQDVLFLYSTSLLNSGMLLK